MTKIAICGCGAIGSQVAMYLVLPDRQFWLFDDDRIDENNILTSVYFTHQIGAYKAGALGAMLYRKCKLEALAIPMLVTKHTRPVLEQVDLVIDCFDNMEARSVTCGLKVPTVHIGVSREHTGAVIWDEDYTLYDGAPRGQEQFCTHQAGRAIIRATAAVAARIVEQFLSTGIKRSVVLTEDFKIFE